MDTAITFTVGSHRLAAQITEIDVDARRWIILIDGRLANKNLSVHEYILSDQSRTVNSKDALYLLNAGFERTLNRVKLFHS